MATKQSDETLVQVATRVPSSLLATVKIWCIQHGVSMVEFVADAVRDKLRRTRIHRL
jgi:hypothetical protein